MFDPTRELPKDLISKFRDVELLGYYQLRNGEFNAAENTYIRQLEDIRLREDQLKRLLHKGGPYHNLGIALANQGKKYEAVNSFLCALTEDFLSISPPEEVKGSLAWKVLKKEFSFSEDDFIRLSKKVKELKREGKVIKTPEIIVNEVFSKVLENILPSEEKEQEEAAPNMMINQTTKKKITLKSSKEIKISPENVFLEEKLESIRERLRQERIVFDTKVKDFNRWSHIRFASGIIILGAFIAIIVFCGYIIFNYRQFSSEIIVAASACFFVDICGMILASWKGILKPTQYSDLVPITK